MNRIKVLARVRNADEAWLGRAWTADGVDVLVRRPTKVYGPDGKLLLVYLPQAIPVADADAARPALHDLRRYESRNRGIYSGKPKGHPIRKSGVRSKTAETEPVPSCVVGYFDAYPRMPFCRECAFTAHEPEKWATLLPMIRSVGRSMEEHVPRRYSAQMDAVRRTHPAFVIPHTPFTTLTVNNSLAAHCHYDRGDLKAGFGALAVFRRGHYRGCWLGLPAYRVAVDMQDRDLLLFDPHQLHGNTPFEDCDPATAGEEWERVSVVFYFREGMLKCGTPEEELAKAKARGALEADDDG